MQGLARKGVDVVYIGGSNTVLAVGGQGVQGANIVLWDTNAHPRAPPVARMTHHSSLVTALQVLSGLLWTCPSGYWQFGFVRAMVTHKPATNISQPQLHAHQV